MDVVGDERSGLERRGGHFTVESLAKELRQEWVEEALSQTERSPSASGSCPRRSPYLAYLAYLAVRVVRRGRIGQP